MPPPCAVTADPSGLRRRPLAQRHQPPGAALPLQPRGGGAAHTGDLLFPAASWVLLSCLCLCRGWGGCVQGARAVLASGSASAGAPMQPFTDPHALQHAQYGVETGKERLVFGLWEISVPVSKHQPSWG